MPYLRNHIAYDHDFSFTCVKWWYLQLFFSVFQNLIFGVVKGQKTVQNDKKLSVTLDISGTIHHMIVIYGSHVCQMIISPCVLFIFWKFWFFGLLGGLEGQNTIQNDKKFCLSCSISQEPFIIWLPFMVHMCQMIISPCNFLFFQNFDFWGC